MKKFYFLAMALIAGTMAANAIVGELPGRFTINAQGDTVHFSQGNLQYNALQKYWSFAEKQYKKDDQDLLTYFAFGTSGWNSGANEYQPYSTSTEPSDYYVGGSWENGLTGDYANADWGIYNAILNGGNRAGLWRVLTMDEWIYILAKRENAAILFSMGTIKWTDSWDNKVYKYEGLILLPDNWVKPEGAKNFLPATQYGLTLVEEAGGELYQNSNLDLQAFTLNTYTREEWEIMEEAGAVFLPALGYAFGLDLRSSGHGVYISSTPQSANQICVLDFNSWDVETPWNPRAGGYSVRLVTRENKGQGVDNVQSDKVQSTKIIRDGQVLILRDGKTFNLLGTELR